MMKNSLNYLKGLLILSGLALALNATAQNFEFEKPYLLKADGKMINTGGITYAAPVLGDYDGDGKDELLVGYWDSAKAGYLMIFENKGSKRNPEFTNDGVLEINGKPAEVHAY